MFTFFVQSFYQIFFYLDTELYCHYINWVPIIINVTVKIDILYIFMQIST